MSLNMVKIFLKRVNKPVLNFVSLLRQNIAQIKAENSDANHLR